MRIKNFNQAVHYGLITPSESEEFISFLEQYEFFDMFNPSFTHEGQPYQDWEDPSERLVEKYEAYQNDRGEYVYVFYFEGDKDRFFKEWEAEQDI